MKTKFYFFVFAAMLFSCANTEKKQTIMNEAPMDENVYYCYNRKYINLNFFEIQDSVFGKFTEIKKPDYYANCFFSDIENKSVVLNGNAFKVSRKGEISMYDSSGAKLKTIQIQEPQNELDNITGNIELFSVSDAVICILRFSDEKGYRIIKLDPKGEMLNKWTIAHTIYKKDGNTIESIPNLYYFAHTGNEAVFSTISYRGPFETIILNLDNGSITKKNEKTGGIIVTDNHTLSGFVFFKEKEIAVEYENNNWKFLSENSCNTARTIINDSTLVVATYSNISTGCAVNAYNAYTGKLLWTGDVKQLMVDHSKYSNTVYLTSYDGKVILEGNEAGGNYLQVLDMKTGKNLFSLMK